jgi:hypothetical protein
MKSRDNEDGGHAHPTFFFGPPVNYEKFMPALALDFEP